MNNTAEKILRVLRCRSGFSLIELMLVCAIFGILAAAVGVYINTGKSEMKTFVFNQKAKFQMARFEAIKRGVDVFVDFDEDGVNGPDDNGYRMWFWDDANNDGIVDAGEDIEIETVTFNNIISSPPKQGPEIFHKVVLGGRPAIAGGPVNGPTANPVGDGVSANGDRFRFFPNGDGVNGTLYLFYPREAGGVKSVSTGPWAIVVNSVGRIRVSEYNQASGAWE